LLNLILNENMKIYRRMRTWIMVAVLIIIVLLVSIVMYNSQPKDNSNWQKNLKQENESNKAVLNETMPKVSKDLIKERIKINEYAIEHNIPPIHNSLWGAVKDLSSLIFLVTILTVVVAGDTVAGEFSTGTIKLLLIRPATRSKILFSKYVSAFLFALFLLIVLFLAAFIINSFLLGFGNIDLPYLHLGPNGSVVESSLILQVLGTYGLACVSLIMIVTLAFMISTVFRSSSLAIAASIVLLLIGTSITSLLGQYAWAKYILFANTDLSQYIEGRPFAEGMTVTFSIIVLLVYFIVFNALSWTIFNKRDVAA